METFKKVGIGILISGLLFGVISEVTAEQKTITTNIFITIREEPKDILAKDQNLSNCLDSQKEKNPESEPEIDAEKVQQGQQEITRYTICEKI